MELSERVVAVLTEKEWQVEVDPDIPGGLMLSPSDGEAPWPFVAQVGPDDQVISFYSLLPDEVAAEHRTTIASLLSQANYGLAIGAFEIDLEDGDVRLRTSIDLGTAELSDEQLSELISPLVAGNLTVMDTWLDALQAVAERRRPGRARRLSPDTQTTES